MEGSPSGGAAAKRHWGRVLTEGMVTGVLGYAAVAVFFALRNVLLGRSALHTAAVLGGLLTGTPVDPATPAIEAGPVLAYNAVHLLVFLAVGLLAAALVFATERYRELWELFLLIFVGIFMVSGFTFAVLIGRAAAVVPWWSIVVADALAAAAMGAYLLYRHPGRPRTIGRADL